MPWGETVEERKKRFLHAFGEAGANRGAVCAEYGISRKAGYALWNRYEAGGEAALKAGSRRPLHSPDRLPEELEQRIVELRRELRWGPRKLRHALQEEKWERVPSKSTIEAVLKRNGCVNEGRSRKSRAFERFEHEQPNELWQADFKGHFGLGSGGRCHPLLVVDDHSRYLVTLRACGDEQRGTVQAILVDAFREVGLPSRMLMDNGPPWGSAGEDAYTGLELWLMRLGVRVSHGKPRRPQTQGKVERLNRTLGEELELAFTDNVDAQRHFDVYRPRYNERRPHEALGMQTPASRYRVSERAYPEQLPPIEYGEGENVKRVQDGGRINYGGRRWRVGKAFVGLPVALRQEEEWKVKVWFCAQEIAELDLRGGTASGLCG
jgi:transposase InsO family protein